MLNDDIVKIGNRIELAEGYLREQLQRQLAHLEGLDPLPKYFAVIRSGFDRRSGWFQESGVEIGLLGKSFPQEHGLPS